MPSHQKYPSDQLFSQLCSMPAAGAQTPVEQKPPQKLNSLSEPLDASAKSSREMAAFGLTHDTTNLGPAGWRGNSVSIILVVTQQVICARAVIVPSASLSRRHVFVVAKPTPQQY